GIYFDKLAECRATSLASLGSAWPIKAVPTLRIEFASL
ncbi:hypothetical protein LINPERHAP1_LOCUS40416, partial [Linum perenne]